MSFYDSSFPPAPGIYRILNTINGKFYVGSAVNLQKRRCEHIRTLRNGTHKNPHLQAAFNVYGEDAFDTEILELVLIPELLTAREQFHIDILQPEYNILKLAGSNLGMIVSEESRRRMSESQRRRVHTPHSEETKAKIAAAKRGKPHKGHKQSEATRAKLSASHTGKVVSESTRAKFRERKHSNATKETLRILSTGRKHSEATKAKLSELGRGPNKGHFKKGVAPLNKGKSPSELTRAKQSAAKKNNPDAMAALIARNKSRKGKPAPNKGIPMSEAQKMKLSEAHKRRKANNNTDAS